MALYGVLGDVHGNLEALRAVLALFQRRGAAQILCVGDIVGYNADAQACVELLRARGALAIAGNHDLISLGRLGFERCALRAVHALRRTRAHLAPASAAWLRDLPLQRLVEGRFLLVHGGVRDVDERLVTPQRLRRNAAEMRADFPGTRICFFGHTHAQLACEIDGAELRELPLGAPVSLSPERDYFLNPGSVDAARKSEPRLAECALFDSEALRIEFCRLAYDHRAAEEKAAAGGYRLGAWRERLQRVLRAATR